MPVNLYYTQRVRGFQQETVKYSEKTVTFTLRRTIHRCPRCGSINVSAEGIRRRSIRGEPLGHCREVYLEFMVHRLYCHKCHAREMEYIPFLSHPKARISKWLERTLLELRPHMSLRALANYFHLRWHTIKDLEKKALKKKFSRIQTEHVKAIGIDEIHVGKGMGNDQYLTIVRDLESGAVIHVGEGKGITALAGALKKLKKSKLKVVTMDMANAYYSWISEKFPQAHIVFDHFHVINTLFKVLQQPLLGKVIRHRTVFSGLPSAPEFPRAVLPPEWISVRFRQEIVPILRLERRFILQFQIHRVLKRGNLVMVATGRPTAPPSQSSR